MQIFKYSIRYSIQFNIQFIFKEKQALKAITSLLPFSWIFLLPFKIFGFFPITAAQPLSYLTIIAMMTSKKYHCS